MFRTIARMAAWASVGFVVYATLVPLAMRPTLGGLGIDYERFAAYVVVSALIVLAYPRHPIRVGFALIALAIILEIAQLAIPGRDARVSDTVVKAVGAMVGMGVAWFWNKWLAGRALRSSETPPIG
jgi:VanZ family protein